MEELGGFSFISLGRGLLGMVVILAIAYAISYNRKRSIGNW